MVVRGGESSHPLGFTPRLEISSGGASPDPATAVMPSGAHAREASQELEAPLQENRRGLRQSLPRSHCPTQQRARETLLEQIDSLLHRRIKLSLNRELPRLPENRGA
jgi:hypothetical protein